MKTLKIVALVILALLLIWAPLLIMAAVDHSKPISAQSLGSCHPCKVPFSCAVHYDASQPARAMIYVPPGGIIRVTSICVTETLNDLPRIGIGPWPDVARWWFSATVGLSPSPATDPGPVFFPGEAIYLVVPWAPTSHRMTVTVAGWAERVD